MQTTTATTEAFNIWVYCRNSVPESLTKLLGNLLMHDTGNAMPGTHRRPPDIAIEDRLITDDQSTYNSQFHVFSNCPQQQQKHLEYGCITATAN